MKNQKTPLRRQPQQQRSQKRVERILDAAAEVFDEVGFEAATTGAIAARANTAIGSLYQFFPDKLAIFHALELRHVERVYAIWDKLFQPEIIQQPFETFIHTIRISFQQLFEQPTSRIVFVQFFTSPAIFKNIDHSFTQEAINSMAELLRKRNQALSDARSHLLAEVCVHGINTLILLALRSQEPHRQEIFTEIEVLMKAYLRPYLGDELLKNSQQKEFTETRSPLEELTQQYQLTNRQRLAINYAIEHGGLTIQNYEALCPQLSRRTLQRDLRAIVEQKLLLPEGKTNQLYYRLNPNLG